VWKAEVKSCLSSSFFIREAEVCKSVLGVKRDLIPRQKSPNLQAKETYATGIREVCKGVKNNLGIEAKEA
jgi:hypothetical protein